MSKSEQAFGYFFVVLIIFIEPVYLCTKETLTLMLFNGS